MSLSDLGILKPPLECGHGVRKNHAVTDEYRHTLETTRIWSIDDLWTNVTKNKRGFRSYNVLLQTTSQKAQAKTPSSAVLI